MSSTCPEPGGTGSRTQIIAHRGASGYLPEHTAVAKALAYGFGVDFIEQDVIATRDRELVVLHDIYLDDVSNVAARFPDRRRDDGHFYVIDFTLAELGELSLIERRSAGSDRPRFPGRFPYDLDSFRVLSLAEEIRLIGGLNASTGNHVGIYPEIKDPAWHAEAGVDLIRLVHDALTAHRDVISGPVYVQSFDANALRRFRRELSSELPLVQLLERDAADALNRDADRLNEIAVYATAVGLPFEVLIAPESTGNSPRRSELVDRLVDAGLQIHAYTMRRDVSPPGGLDYFEALRFLINELEIEGLFCDHPDDALAVRNSTAA